MKTVCSMGWILGPLVLQSNMLATKTLRPERVCCLFVCSGVGTIAVLYCVVLVTVKYFTPMPDSKHGPVRHKWVHNFVVFTELTHWIQGWPWDVLAVKTAEKCLSCFWKWEEGLVGASQASDGSWLWLLKCLLLVDKLAAFMVYLYIGLVCAIY